MKPKLTFKAGLWYVTDKTVIGIADTVDMAWRRYIVKLNIKEREDRYTKECNDNPERTKWVRENKYRYKDWATASRRYDSEFR